jgi:hypothetical protein
MTHYETRENKNGGGVAEYMNLQGGNKNNIKKYAEILL